MKQQHPCSLSTYAAMYNMHSGEQYEYQDGASTSTHRDYIEAPAFLYDVDQDIKQMKSALGATDFLADSGYQSIIEKCKESSSLAASLLPLDMGMDEQSDADDSTDDTWDGFVTVGPERVRIKDLSDILATRFALMTGARTCDDLTIVTFPDSRCLLSFESYRLLVTYLLQVHPMEDAQRGFILIVDRRGDKWSSVRTLFVHLNSFFPGKIHVVYLLKPEGVLQRALEVGYRGIADSCSFKVVQFDTSVELRSCFKAEQLTMDIGGLIKYNHLEYVQHRMDIERMKSSTSAIAESLNEFAKSLRETELPNDADTTARILQTQTCERQAIKEDIKIAMRKCTALLRSVRQNEQKPSAAQLSPTRLHNVTAIERMLVQLEETERSFDIFWSRHERRLTNCLQLRQFEDSFRKLQASFARHMLYLEEHRGIGDGVQQAGELAKQHEQYTQTAMEDVVAGKELKKKGDELRMTNEDELNDSVLPKCDELDRMADALTSALERRAKVLRMSCTMHDEIGRANAWCSRGVDLLTSTPVLSDSSSTSARSTLSKLDSFLDEFANIRLDSWLGQDPAENFVLLTTTETSTLITQVAERMKDIMRISAARRDTIAKTEEARSRQPPVQVVTPEKKHKKVDEGVEKEKRRAMEQEEAEDEVLRIEEDENDDVSPPPSATERELDCSFEAMEGSSLPVEPSSSRSLQSCVINELITTEQTYVSELESIVEFYVRPLQSLDPSLLSAELKARAHLLFGNLPDLLDFHSHAFLPHLASQPTPSHIGKAFVAYKDRFLHLYHHYCQNKATSEAIRKEFGDSTPFFMECQRRAGHLLPLGAYLLKPVQRITKYQLLLRELERHCNPEVRSDVVCALSTMLELLAQINSTINQLNITGYNGDLRLLGPLRLQADCSIYTYNRRKKGARLGRAQRRYALLFDGGLLFCKKKNAVAGQPNTIETEHFEHKLFIPTHSLAFCESSRYGFERFDVWDTARLEAYVVEILDFGMRSRWLERLGHSLTSEPQQLIGEVGADSKRRPKSWSSTISNESTASSAHTSDSMDSQMDSNGNTHCSPLNSSPRFPPSISSPANISLEIDTSPNQYTNFDETEELIDSV